MLDFLKKKFGKGEPEQKDTQTQKVTDEQKKTEESAIIKRATPKALFKFSVSPTQKVIFSHGNIQYQASTNTWRFAEHQWDMIGEANNAISPTNSGWIDLFGWGTGNAPTNSSSNDADYSSYHEWGDNIIQNGMDRKWRTLTMDEWMFVIMERRTNSGIRYAKANVNGINGLILLPDNWDESYYQLSNVNEGESKFNDNTISANEWTDKLETHGAVFMPAAGERLGNSVNLCGWSSYWSSSSFEENGKDCANTGFSVRSVGSYQLGTRSMAQRSEGKSVRLVCDIDSNEEEAASLAPGIEVRITQKNGQGQGNLFENSQTMEFSIGDVPFNMVFVEGSAFMMGGEARNGTEDNMNLPRHEVTLSDYYISETPVTQRLWKTILGENPSKYKDRGDDKPVTGVGYDEIVNRFIPKLNELWADKGVVFALPTEAEWEFAGRGGKKSKGYKYAGSDNLGDVAWMTDNSNDTVHNVKEKQPNELGLYDMSGNVWEWCHDFYGVYEGIAQTNPSGPSTGKNRVVRGGDYSQNEKACRVNMRLFMSADFYWNTGFRLVIRTKPLGKNIEKSKTVLEEEKKHAKETALSMLKLFCSSRIEGIKILTVVDDYFVIVRDAAAANMPDGLMQIAKNLPEGTAKAMLLNMVKQKEWHMPLNAISLLGYGLRIVLVLGTEMTHVELNGKQLAEEFERMGYKPDYDLFYT